AAHIGWRYPVRLVRDQESRIRPMGFSFYGPTCDDLDHMAGPFELPGDVGVGDYIEIGMLGAYGCAMRTQFNGFGVVESVIVSDAMGKIGFRSRDLARATKIYNTMREDQSCSIILVIAGSTSAGGCMDLYAELVRSNMVDAIVATGATIVDMDFFEALGHKHYQANEIPDDDTLRSLYIDRIYDTYIDEEQLQDCDHTIGLIADSLE